MTERLEVTREIAASPEAVYAAISDVTRMGEWSEECVACEWHEGVDGAAVGAVFDGHNRHGDHEWTSQGTVIEADPGRSFAFECSMFGFHFSTWGYRIESPPLSALVVDRAQGWPAAPPAILAARALRTALQRRGVVVRRPVGTGRAPAEAARLARVESAPLAELVHAMNTDSDNFLAEMLLKQLGAADGQVGTTARGARAVVAELRAAGIPTAGVRLVDGSGLSSLDRVTAEMLVGVLRAAIADPQVRRPFLRSLAVSGRTGTLIDRGGLPAGGVLGKTGTTNLACTLSGVLRRTVAFAVLQNGAPVASWAARGAQDRFVTALARGTSGT